MKKILIVVIIFLTLNNVLNAETPQIQSISSFSIGDKDTVVISGLNFGKKSKAAPLVFDNFDTNTTSRQNGDVIKDKFCSHFGRWKNSQSGGSANADGMAPTYTNQNNKNNSTLCSYHYFKTNDVHWAPMWIKFSEENTKTIIFRYWARFNIIRDPTNSETSFQIKWTRLTSEANEFYEPDVDPNTTFQSFIWPNKNDDLSPTHFNYNKHVMMGLYQQTGFTSWPNYEALPQNKGNTSGNVWYKETEGEWQQYLLMVKQGTLNESDGKARLYINGDLTLIEDAMKNNTRKTWVPSGKTEPITLQTDVRQATFGWYLANNPGEDITELNFDDIYIDNTWASVWIGDSPSWNTCTLREPQIPKKWPRIKDGAPHRIEFEVNKSIFNTGDLAYVFVMDEDGEVSSGKQIIFH